VRTYVAVTDADWYRFLAAQPGLTEVNFWRPRDTREFRAIGVGEPFFFKTHAPHNRIVGGGFYSSSANLRLSEAWEWFGTANGVASLAEMRTRIARYRPVGPGEDPVIGCLFIRDPAFFAAGETISPPPDYPRSGAMQGKSYDLATEPHAGYFGDLIQRVLGAAVDLDLTAPWHRKGPVFGDPACPRNAWASRPSRPWSLTHTFVVLGLQDRPELDAGLQVAAGFADGLEGAVQLGWPGAPAVAQEPVMLAAEAGHFRADRAGGELRGLAVEGLDFLGDGEVLIGDGAAGAFSRPS